MFISNAWRAFLELEFYDCMVKIIPHIYQKNCSYLSYLPRYISKRIVLTGLIFESLQNTLLHPVVCIQAIKIWLQNYHGRFKTIIANNYYHCLCNGYFQLIFPTAPREFIETSGRSSKYFNQFQPITYLFLWQTGHNQSWPRASKSLQFLQTLMLQPLKLNEISFS